MFDPYEQNLIIYMTRSDKIYIILLFKKMILII